MLIYAADDEKTALLFLEETIRLCCPSDEIHIFDRPSKLLEAFRRRSADVVFMDIEMPGMTGIELARALQTINERINIVFVTGYSDYATEAFDVFASGYVLKPIGEEGIRKALSGLRYPIAAPKEIFLKTFGNFEVFFKGEPVHFRSPQSKEMLAYLVDREGTLVSRQEMAGILFEDSYSRSTQVRLSQIANRLEEDLESVGIRDFFFRDDGYRVELSAADCDLVAYLNGSKQYPFIGEYMEQYTFGEYRKGMLFQK